MSRPADQSAIGLKVFDWAERGAAHTTVVRDNRDTRGSGITLTQLGVAEPGRLSLCSLIIYQRVNRAYIYQSTHQIFSSSLAYKCI